MADGVQTLEKRLQRLELLLAATDAPEKIVKLDRTGKPGALQAQFDEEARKHGFVDANQMSEIAGTVFAGASLPYIQNRRVGIVTPKQAEDCLKRHWSPYGNIDSSSTNSLANGTEVLPFNDSGSLAEGNDQ